MPDQTDYSTLLAPYINPVPAPTLPTIDPQELERAKYLGLARMGMGMVQREPIGHAMSAGISAYTSAQTDTRRNAELQMQMALKQYELNQQMAEDARRAVLAKSIPDAYFKSMGVPDAKILAFRLAKDPGAFMNAWEELKPYTMSGGQARFNANNQVVAQMPTADKGTYPEVDPNGNFTGRQRQLAGVTENMAAQAAATEAGTQSQRYQQLGTDATAAPIFGYPVPPALRSTSAAPTAAASSGPPMRINFEGTPEQIMQHVQQAIAANAQVPNVIDQRKGISPTDAANAQADFARLSKNYDALSNTIQNGIESTYRARDALKAGAFSGPLSGWKSGFFALWNANAPDGWQMKVPQTENTYELKKAMGEQLLANAKALGSQPTGPEEKKIMEIVGASTDPREALDKGLPFLESMMRRQADAHNKQVDQYSSRFTPPSDIKINIPSYKEYQARLQAASVPPGDREAAPAAAAAPPGAPPAAVVPPAPATATQKAIDTNIATKVRTSGIPYEPAKYDYRIGPNGEIQRKPK